MRGAHHNALENRLSAYESFFAALKRGQELNGGQESEIVE
jgi:hypothetical protein